MRVLTTSEEIASELEDVAVAKSLAWGAPVTRCPHCGTPYDVRGFVQEYWTSERRVFTCWCAACHFVCDVVVVDRVLSFEPEH